AVCPRPDEQADAGERAGGFVAGRLARAEATSAVAEDASRKDPLRVDVAGDRGVCGDRPETSGRDANGSAVPDRFSTEQCRSLLRALPGEDDRAGEPRGVL